MKTLQNKVCLITGSSQGIGLTTAVQLLRQGAYVILNGRKRNYSIPAKLHPFEDRVTYIPADISEASEAQQLISASLNRFNALDVVINNAGISSIGNFEITEPSVFSKIVSTNLLGSAYVTHYAIPHLKKTNGYILFISSIAGMHGMKNYAGYSASKMALTSLCQSLRKELDQTGVDVGAAYLSFTQNDPAKRFLTPTGNTTQVPNRKGMKVHSQIETANLILNQIETRKPVCIHSLLGKFTYVANRISPNLVHSFLLNRSVD